MLYELHKRLVTPFVVEIQESLVAMRYASVTKLWDATSTIIGLSLGGQDWGPQYEKSSGIEEDFAPSTIVLA